MGSFESTSVCAGEVANAASIFPKAIFITVLVVLSNYILPIMAFRNIFSKVSSLSLSLLSPLSSLSLSLSLFLSFSTHTHTHTHSGLDGDYSGYDNGHYITVARTVGGSYLGAGLGAAQAQTLNPKPKP